MRNRMIWGLAILIILIIGVSVFLLTRTTETEPEEVYNPPTPAEKEQVDRSIQDAIDKSKKNLPPIAEGDRQQVEIDKPKTAEKSVPVTMNTGDGIIPNFGLVDLENPPLEVFIPLRTTNVPGIDIDWVSLSPQDLADTIAKLERGEIHAPEGYEYRRTRSDGELKLILDQNGYPIIHKDGEPHISVLFRMGFTPTREVLKEYFELYDEYCFLELHADDSPEMRELQSRMDELKNTYRGPRPTTYSISGGLPSGVSRSDADAIFSRARIKVSNELSRLMGLISLAKRPE